MAENHRHSAASSSSVNSYVVDEHALSAADRTPLTVSGNGTTFVCFDTLSPRPRLRLHFCSHAPPNATAPYRPPITSPLPFRRRTGKANACRLLVASRLIQHTGQNRSLNTIRRRFRVNRGHIHFKVFQRSVSLQPQWQNGDAFKLAVWGAPDCRPTLEHRLPRDV
jgi:hypothetical protein